MLALPPQSPAVVRDPTAGLVRHESRDVDGAAALQSFDSVCASQSQCSHLTGPAQSLCYAALYGVSV